MKLVKAAHLNQSIRLKNSIGVWDGIKGLEALIYVRDPHLGGILVHLKRGGEQGPLTIPVPGWPLRLVTRGAPLPAKTVAVWPA
jgi:hypothetical protein